MTREQTKKVHSLEERIDLVLNNINERNPVLLKKNTPKVLTDLGIDNLPMYENPSHVRKNILSENQASKIKLKIHYNDHYHELGKKLFIKVIKEINSPRMILKSQNEKEYLIITSNTDSKGNIIVIPIEVNTKTNIDSRTIAINRIKSIYAYDKNHPSLMEYINYVILNKKYEKIYEKKEQGTGISTAASSYESSIPQRFK